MSKPFNFEEFKAGKPAMLGNLKIEFHSYLPEIKRSIICKLTLIDGDVIINSYREDFLQVNATMLPTKRTVWIAICEYISSKYKWSYSAFFNSKDDAMKLDGGDCWKVIDAIPYEIEE